MSHSPIPHEAVCLLNRFHNSTVLKKYGSGQKGLRTRKKKTKAARLSKMREPVFYRTKAINILCFVTDALVISIPFVLHWMLTALTVVCFVLYCVCKGVFTSNLFFVVMTTAVTKPHPKVHCLFMSRTWLFSCCQCYLAQQPITRDQTLGAEE